GGLLPPLAFILALRQQVAAGHQIRAPEFSRHGTTPPWEGQQRSRIESASSAERLHRAPMTPLPATLYAGRSRAARRGSTRLPRLVHQILVDPFLDLAREGRHGPHELLLVGAEHDLAKNRQRRAAPGLLAAQRTVVVEADPDR